MLCGPADRVVWSWQRPAGLLETRSAQRGFPRLLAAVARRGRPSEGQVVGAGQINSRPQSGPRTVAPGFSRGYATPQGQAPWRGGRNQIHAAAGPVAQTALLIRALASQAAQRRLNPSPGCNPGNQPNPIKIRGLGPASADAGSRPRNLLCSPPFLPSCRITKYESY